MNRIYQGRVSRAEMLDSNGEILSKPDWDWEGALWDHHALFQDAVNYWSFALAVMAEGMTWKNEDGKDKATPMARFAEQLRGNQKQGTDRIEGRWEDFTHKGTKREGLKKSLSRTLGISLEELDNDGWRKCAERVFAAVLKKFPDRKDMKGNDMLHGVIGELFPDKSRAVPKKLANEDPGWLCWRDKKGEFPAEKTYRNQQGIYDFMGDLLLADEGALKSLAEKTVAETCLSGVTKTKMEESDDDAADAGNDASDSEDSEQEDDVPEVVKCISGVKAINQLRKCVKTAKALLKEPDFARDFTLLGGNRFSARGELTKLLKSVRREKANVVKSSASLSFQDWKRAGEGKDNQRVELFVLLHFAGKYHPQGLEFTAALLRTRLKSRLIGAFRKNSPDRYLAFVKAFNLDGIATEGKETPKQIETARKAAEKMARGEVRPRLIKTDFIPRIRKEVGYVFPSFTAIRGFAAESGADGVCQPGTMGWKKFDSAAYEEAIKSPHQIREKQKERDTERKKLESLEKLYEGKGRLKGQDDDGEDEEHIPGGFTKDGDPRFSAMERVREVLRVEDGVDPGAFHEYTISQAALRGYDELRNAWNKEVEAGEEFSVPKAEKLKEMLKTHQREHREDVGAVRLFEEFLKIDNWCVWQVAKEDVEKERAGKNYSENFVRDYLRFVETVDNRKSKEKPIQYTPADRKESRRLFDFKGGSFIKHAASEDGLSLTTKIAVQGCDGLYRPQNVLIRYKAPRLLRDEARVLSKSENLKTANWAQPMMRAVGMPAESCHDFKMHAVSLMPEWNRGSRAPAPERLLLNFVLTPKEEAFITNLRKQMKREQWPWAMQFNWNGDGHDSTLRWPQEDWSKVKSRTGFPGQWFSNPTLTSFRFLSVDLGQKQAGAYALLEASCCWSDEERKNARFIGRTGAGADQRIWYVRVITTGLHKLPGEDAEVFRPAFDHGKPVPGSKAFREELSGSAGRTATLEESRITIAFLRGLEQLDLLDEDARDAKTLCERLAFPAQNAKMLVAMRRTQSFASRLHRWCWFLDPQEAKDRKDSAMRRKTAIREIAESDDHPWLDAEAHKLAKELHMRIIEAQKKEEPEPATNDPRIPGSLKKRLETLIKELPACLEVIANRVYASRKGRFAWLAHPDKSDCHLLDFVEFDEEEIKTRKDLSKDEKRLAGQRGLSMERIEQIEELRKRCQSLNQMLRRKVGEAPKATRDDSIPDPCPKILEKLDDIKEQRRNQTAHMILAEALGLALVEPSEPKSNFERKMREDKDSHGEYVKVDDKGWRLADGEVNKWRGIVDFIVIEDLSRYRTSQGRAPRENSRLMKWCHRAIRDKLKQMCEPFGVPLVETPAAYSSRFCSRTGVAGFRGVELPVSALSNSKWTWKVRKPEDETKEPPEQKRRREQWNLVFEQVRKANENRDGKSEGQKFRTLLVPDAGGSVFIPMAELNSDHKRLEKDPAQPKKHRPIIEYRAVKLEELQEKAPRLIHADINAAVNLGLRAVSDARVWSIHSRLRSEREFGAPPLPKNKKAQEKKKESKTREIPKAEIKPDRFWVSEKEKRKYPKQSQKPSDETASVHSEADDDKATRTHRIEIKLGDLKKADLKASESRHPNFFADFANLKGTHWGASSLSGSPSDCPMPVHLVSAKSLWGYVKGQAWKRCEQINGARLKAWDLPVPKEWERDEDDNI